MTAAAYVIVWALCLLTVLIVLAVGGTLAMVCCAPIFWATSRLVKEATR